MGSCETLKGSVMETHFRTPRGRGAERSDEMCGQGFTSQRAPNTAELSAPVTHAGRIATPVPTEGTSGGITASTP